MAWEQSKWDFETFKKIQENISDITFTLLLIYFAIAISRDIL